MRQFLSSLLGTLAGLILFVVGGTVLLFAVLGFIGSAVSTKKVSTVSDGAYLVFNMNVNVADAPPQFGEGFPSLLGGNDGPKTLQLRQITQALKAAATDSRIKGLYLEGNLSPEGYGTGAAAIKEVRDAILDFKKSGKPVLAYLYFANLKDIYLASSASEVVLDPYGAIVFPGLASETMFLAGAFEKFGVGVQVTRVGKYKSAIEPYLRKDMSEASRLQLQELLDSVWTDLKTEIAASSGAKVADLQKLADAKGIVRPEDAKAAKLVSRIAYRDTVLKELHKKTNATGRSDEFVSVDLAAYSKTVPNSVMAANPLTTFSGSRIAVVYAEGAIVEGNGAEGEIGGERFAQEIARLREDSDIKAIVLRVNSPGGSVGASEHIQREIRLAKKSKPVVVSMGSYAASGGYWISAYGDRIFAQKNTITGSIGVFGLQLNIEKLAASVGLTFDRVKTAEKGDILSVSRPKSDAEIEVFQQMVDWIYEQFLSKVAEGRSLKKDAVHEIAQGRVWAGATALKLGLVDEIGGLDDAIAFASKKAGLGATPVIEEFPRKRTFNEVFSEIMEKAGEGESRANRLSTRIARQVEAEVRKLDEFNDSKGIYARLPFEVSLP